MKLTAKILSLVICSVPALLARADIIVTNLDPITAVYDGGTIATGGGGLAQPNLANGHAFNIEFTPTAADTNNTVLLMEIGGTANGTGLYLVNGVLAYLTKQGSGDGQTPTGLNDTALNAAAITNTFGAVSPGVAYTAAASWNNAGTLILAIQADSMATGKVDNVAITGTYGNWSGDESWSVGTNPRLGAGGPGGSVGGMSGEGAGNEFGEPFDVEDDADTPILKGFVGTISRALYWNNVGQIGLFPPPIVLGKSWTNSGTGAWGVAANWNPNGAPTGADSPKINNGGTAQIADGNNYEVDQLLLATGAGNSGTLQISSGSLTITNETCDFGSGTGASGTITVSGTGRLSTLGQIRFGVDGATVNFTQTGGTVEASVFRPGVDNNNITAGGTANVNLNGGVFYCTNDLNIGRDSDIGVVTVNGGALTNYNLSLAADDFITIGGPNGTGTLAVASGTVYTAAGIRMANGATAQGTLNLNGGTLTTPQIFKGNAGSLATVNFNGGTLVVLTNNNPLVTSNAGFTLNVGNGGAIIDTAGYDSEIQLPLSAFGSGGLTKNGAGTLFVAAANYSGNTVVNAGKLKLGLPSSAAGTLTVANGAGLAVLQQGAFDSITPSAVTLGSGGATTVDFDFGAASNPSSAAVSCFGTVTANGTVTITISGTGLSIGQFPLISYGTLAGGGFGAFTLSTNLPTGVTANLVNTGSAIALNITAAGKNVTWSGANGTAWNTSAVNWINTDTLAPATYAQSGGFGDRVRFDDSHFTGNTNINVALTVTPQAMTVANSSYAYSFGGANPISGGGALTKSGTSSLTLLSSNSYSGGTIVQDGIIRVGNNAALGSGPVTLQASLATLTSDGATARTIPNDINYNTDLVLGDATFNGVLTLAGDTDLGTANRNLTLNSDVVISGSMTNAVADVGLNSITGPGRLTVSASGYVSIAELFEQVNGGVVVDGGTFINVEGYRIAAPQPNSTQLLLVTNNGYFAMDHQPGTGGNLVIGTSASASDATATNLIEVASGTVLARTPSGNNGQIIFSQNNGGAASIMNVRAAGTVQCRRFVGQQATSGRLSELNLHGGKIMPIADEGEFINSMSNVFVHTGVIVDTVTNNITIPQPLLAGTGGGGLTKQGTGALYLTGANTYTGTTLVSAGTFGGTGSVAGPVSVSSGATFSPGTSVGTFTVNNNLALGAGSQTLVELDKALVQSNDVVVVTGTLTYGGALTITNLGTNALVAGDTFTVFPVGGSSTFSSVQGEAGPGLAFQFNNGVVSVVSAAAPSLDFVRSGNTLTFTWSDANFGLQAQTNALAVGLKSTGWAPYSGGTTSGTVVTIVPTNPAVFFRLAK